MNNLLLLHGALGSQAQLMPLRAQLESQFQVHSLNFAGHGGEASDQDFSIQLFTDNVLQFLDAQALEQVDIFGYSMGGYVALNLAAQHPGRVGKIMTLGTKFDWTEESAARETRMLNPEKIEAKVPAFARQLEAVHQPVSWKLVLEKTAAMMTGLGAGKGLTDADLGGIAQEVLIGIGSLDKMVSQAESERAAALLPQGELRVIEDFPHPIDQVEAGKLAEIVAGFMLGE